MVLDTGLWLADYVTRYQPLIGWDWDIPTWSIYDGDCVITICDWRLAATNSVFTRVTTRCLGPGWELRSYHSCHTSCHASCHSVTTRCLGPGWELRQRKLVLWECDGCHGPHASSQQAQTNRKIFVKSPKNLILNLTFAHLGPLSI